MAGAHRYINLHNDISDVDDLIAVEGKITSLNQYTGLATVKVPRWGTIPNVPILYLSLIHI